MNVHRVTNPQALEVPMVRDFMLKAAEACKIPAADLVPDAIAFMVQMPNVGLFVSQDENGLQGMALITLPDNPFMFKPQFAMAYSDEPGAVRPSIEAALDFARANGYNDAWGLNITGVPDKVMQRIFSYIPEVNVVGSVMEYKF